MRKYDMAEVKHCFTTSVAPPLLGHASGIDKGILFKLYLILPLLSSRSTFSDLAAPRCFFHHFHCIRPCFTFHFIFRFWPHHASFRAFSDRVEVHIVYEWAPRAKYLAREHFMSSAFREPDWLSHWALRSGPGSNPQNVVFFFFSRT